MIVCPLCFAAVDTERAIGRLCTNASHHAAPQLQVTASGFDQLWCPECLAEESYSADLYRQYTALWHVGCTCKSPLASEWIQAGRPPLTGHSDQPQLLTEHRQIGWMRSLYDLPNSDTLGDEMVFSHLLFETVNSRQKGKKAAVSTLLLGEQRSGKSYLATMAVRPQTWERSEAGSKFQPFNYVYTTPTEGEGRPWAPLAEATVAVAVDTVPEGKVLIPATVLMLRHNIRALFLKSPSGASSTAAVVARKKNTRFGRYKNLVGSYLNLMHNDSARSHGTQARPSADGNLHRAVIFHDIKGEQGRTGFDAQVMRLVQSCDRVAVVVPATDLGCFRDTILNDQELSRRAGIDQTYNAMQTVRRSVDLAKPVRQKVLVVVTKLDAVRDLELPASKFPKWSRHRRALKDPDSYAPSSATDERETLLELLGDSDGEKALRNLITQSNVPVFFAWYEPGTAEPKAGGVVRFVLDGCLGSV